MPETLFVYIDSTSNAVFSKGLTPADFADSVVHQPENLLLLDPAAELGEFETHTGLKIIEGPKEVQQFFANKQAGQSAMTKWIDFTDTALLKELAPLEISELLYFGHMRTHLHSPFFYKLQNNFVYFSLGHDLMRVYYRYLDEFYHVLSSKITRIVLEKVNDRRSFFRRGTPVTHLEGDVLKKLYTIFQEGAIFDLTKAYLQDKSFQIPIYLSDEKGWRKDHRTLTEEQHIATLVYDCSQQTWDLSVESEDIAFAIR